MLAPPQAPLRSRKVEIVSYHPPHCYPTSYRRGYDLTISLCARLDHTAAPEQVAEVSLGSDAERAGAHLGKGVSTLQLRQRRWGVWGCWPHARRAHLGSQAAGGHV